MSLPKRSWGRCCQLPAGTPPQPPGAHVDSPEQTQGCGIPARGGPSGSPRCDRERRLRQDPSVLLIRGRWSQPSNETRELEVPFQTRGSSPRTSTAQPQTAWGLTFQSPEGLPAGAVGSVAGSRVPPWHGGPLGLGRARLRFGAPAGPRRRVSASLPAPGKAPRVLPARRPAAASHS